VIIVTKDSDRTNHISIISDLVIKLVPADFGSPDIESASSLLSFNNRIFVCCDDLYELIELQNDNSWIKHKWNDAPPLPINKEERKKLKPDFEALLCLKEDSDKILLIPSGSKPNRTMGLEFNLKLNQFSQKSLTDLYLNFSKVLTQINIEGTTLYQDSYIFLNRGVGTELSSLVVVDAKTFRIELVKTIDFGAISGCPFHGSEMCIFKGKLFTVAVAEATENTYDDGEIMGSALFQICLSHFEILNQWMFDLPVKIEGLCRMQDKWLVATDPDGRGQGEFFTFNL